MTAEGWRWRYSRRVALVPRTVVCLLMLALLTALSALHVHGVYAGTVARSKIEWFEASMKAQDTAIAHFSQDGTPWNGVGFVWTYHVECFPTESAWFWGRIREPSEVLAARARDSYVRCLDDYARIERQKSGWRPPRRDQVKLPQNNQMQQRRSGSYGGARS